MVVEHEQPEGSQRDRMEQPISGVAAIAQHWHRPSSPMGAVLIAGAQAARVCSAIPFHERRPRPAEPPGRRTRDGARTREPGASRTLRPMQADGGRRLVGRPERELTRMDATDGNHAR